MNKFLILAILVLTSTMVTSQSIRRDGTKIVDQGGNQVILRGMGLGGWMLQEGYMMQSSDVADTQHEFRERLESLMGVEKTDEFYDAWLENHVTKADIDSLASWGFNSVRLPMHYNLYTLPIEDEPIQGENTWLTKGFVMTDSLLSWCKSNNIYLILDLHAAPGGQGANAAISDYDPSKPSLWENQYNRDKTVALWGKLADRYKDEPWIGGYDLLNEVNWELPGNTMLRQLYGEITDIIREVDTDHIIFIEGNWFANDFSGLTPPWDDNMAYSFHKYWNYNDQGSVDWVLNMTNQHNVPVWMGEAGENSNVWFHDAIKLFEENEIGWSWWPMKRIETIVSPFSIPFTDGYKDILAYWRNQGPKPTVDEAYTSMMELAYNTNSLNCPYQKDVHDAQIRQITTDATIPYNDNIIPGILYMADYDLGSLNNAYYDIDNVNYSLSTGQFQAWNQGWVYRNDGVDIEANSDPINSNGFHIGFIAKEEWTNYTTTITESGVYRAVVRVASTENGGKFHLALDGEDITEIQSVSSTGGWVNFENITIEDIILTEGEHKITLWFDDNKAFNISSIEFTRTGNIEDLGFNAVNGNTGVDEKSVEIALNQVINPESITNSKDNFTLLVNGQEITINEVVIPENKERTIRLNIDDFLVYTDQVNVSYDGTLITSANGKELNTFEELVIRNTLQTRFILPKKIQAEDYSDMLGLGIEDCTDVGGGKNIGYTNSGDYADYLIFVDEDEEFFLNLRIASLYGSAKLEFHLIDENSVDTKLTDFTVPSTGGWQTWKTISNYMIVPKGVYTLRMLVVSGEFNMNWFQFEIAQDNDENDQMKSESFAYPNPVSGNQMYIITGSDDNSTTSINIYNTTGQLLSSASYKLNNGNTEIDITDIPKGLAILRLATKNKTHNIKIIKQ